MCSADCGQLNVFIIIEGDYVAAAVGNESDALGVGADGGVSADRDRVLGDGLAYGLVCNNLIVGNLILGTVPEISDGIARLVKLEVKLQYETEICGDSAALNVRSCGVIDVLAVVLVCLVSGGDRDGGVGLALTCLAAVCGGGVCTVNVLIVELDLVVHVDGFPDGVEVVGAVVVQTGFGACGVPNAVCILPALDLVAGTGGKTR